MALRFLESLKKRESFKRIIAALRFRIVKLVQAPSIEELEFMSLTVNHGHYSEKLRRLGHPSAAEQIQKNAFFVGLRWMELAHEHLHDAADSLSSSSKRSTFSRSYYAVYSASKAVRYIVFGAVSLKGDDHHKASELPDDFPSGDKWAQMIPKLYEHRLFSDYDNWKSTASQHSLTPQESYDLADLFLRDAGSYLQQKFGI